MLAYYVDAVRRAAEEKARLEGLVEAEARKPRWRRRVDSLRCLKGVDTATAADLVFEAGEFSRFRNARSFAAWVGLAVSVNIFFTIFTNVFSPIAPTRMRRIRLRGCAAFGV